MAAYECPVCTYVYDETTGAPPHEGFPAGTAWASVPPDDWCCPPDCGVREKIDFEPRGV